MKKITKITTKVLINDYLKIQKIESEYWKILRKYDPKAIFETDECTVAIQLELGRRQIYLSKVEEN